MTPEEIIKKFQGKKLLKTNGKPNRTHRKLIAEINKQDRLPAMRLWNYFGLILNSKP